MKPITETLSDSDSDSCSEDRTNGTQASPEGLTRRTFLRQSAQLGAAITTALPIGLGLPSAYAAASGTASNKESSFEAIKQQARELMAQYHVPGLAIGVISGKDVLSAGVITSYSIHYTKLYDTCAARASTCCRQSTN